MNVIKVFIVNIIVLLFAFEILARVIFLHPTRFYYPLSSLTQDIQEDWNVDYKVDWRSGQRISSCNNEVDITNNKEVLIVGDSYAFGAGLMIEDTFFYKMSCNQKYNIKNLAAMGTGLDFYSKVIRQSNLKNVEEIILIFSENDGDIRIDNSQLMSLKNKLRYSLFSYTVLRSLFRKIKTLELINKSEDYSKINNLNFIFGKNSNHIEDWFKFNDKKVKYIDNEFNKISKYILSKNKKILLKTLVIPDPSVISDTHRDLYKKYGADFLPKKNQPSNLAKKILEHSEKYNFQYLPFYELMIATNKIKDQKYYFQYDFHLNEKGNLFLYNFLTKYLSKFET